MSSVLIILVGFVMSAIIMLIVWFVSKNVQNKRFNKAQIEKQKADIISLIEESVNDVSEARNLRPRITLGVSRSGLPIWGKCLMGIAWLPFIVATVIAGMHGLSQKPNPAITLSSIGIAPTSPLKNLPVDGTELFKAVATYSDGLTEDVSSQVTWASSDINTALMRSDGSAFGIAAGTVNITASLSGITSPPVTLSVIASVSTTTSMAATPEIKSYMVGDKPDSICFDGTNIWVANYGSNSISKLRPTDGTILGMYTMGVGPTFICFDGTNIWVANYGSNSVTKLRPSDGTILGTYTVGVGPTFICFDGTNIWVTNYGSISITKLRASDGSILGTYTVGSHPQAICFDGTNIWVAANSISNSIIAKLRASDGSILGTYAVGWSPQGICFDGTNIWVAANSVSNSISIIAKLRASDGSILGTYAESTMITGVEGICFDGTNIWVCNYNYDFVTRLKSSDGSIIGTYKVGTNPQEICFDGTNIWVANTGSDSITKLPMTIMPTTTTTPLPIPTTSRPSTTTSVISTTTVIATTPFLTTTPATTTTVITTTPSLTASVLNPANDAMGVPVNFTFSWPAATGTGVTYGFVLAEELGNVDKFAIIDYSVVAPTNTTPLRETLKYNTIYWWKVRAVTATSTGDWAIYMFTTTNK